MTSDPAIIRGMTQPGQPSNLQGLSDAATIGGTTPPPDSLDLGCLIRFGRVVAADDFMLSVDVPASRTDLIIKVFGTIDAASGAFTFYVQFNHDETDVYNWSWFFAQEGLDVGVVRPLRFWHHVTSGATVIPSNDTSGSDDDFGIQVVAEYNGQQTPYVPASTELIVPEYRSAFWKHCRGAGDYITLPFGGATVFGSGHVMIAGLYKKADPITSVQVRSDAFGGSGSGNFVDGSVLEVWGRC